METDFYTPFLHQGMNQYNKFLAKSVIKKFFPDDYDKVYDGYLEFLKENLHRTFSSSTLTHTESFDFPRNAIYVSFHYGPFLYIPYFLVTETDLNVKFIVSKSSLGKIDYFFQFARDKGINFTDENIIIGDSLKGIKRIVSAIKNKETLFVLIDISVGINQIDKSKNTFNINFLGNQLYVRSAVLNLAVKFDYPVVLSLANWYKEERCLKFSTIRNDSIDEMLNTVWCSFEQCLLEDPTQWESYHTIYKYMRKPRRPIKYPQQRSNEKFAFCEKNFQMITDKGSIYLGARQTFEIFRISPELASLIDSCAEAQIPFTIKEFSEVFNNDEILDDLIYHEIIVNVGENKSIAKRV